MEYGTQKVNKGTGYSIRADNCKSICYHPFEMESARKKGWTPFQKRLGITKTCLFNKYTENFQIKKSDIHISAQNIDCGYSQSVFEQK